MHEMEPQKRSVKFNHQLLLLLHVTEFIIVNNVGVVEKEVVFACQFNLDLVDLVDSLSAILQRSNDRGDVKIDSCSLTNRSTLILIASRVPTSCGPCPGS